MAALVKSSTTGTTVSDGTRQLPAVANLGADGDNFQPAMDAVTRPGFQRLTDGTTALPFVGTNKLPVGAQAVAVGGATPYSLIVAASANATVVKSTAGTLYAINVQSIVAGIRYLKLYDKSTAPTSSDTPVLRVTIPGNTSGAVVSVPLPDCGVAFANGVGFRVVTGQADADNTSVTAGDNVINLVYA
jgi:hypothetical protein